MLKLKAMGIFSKIKKTDSSKQAPAQQTAADNSALASLVLNTINEGVIIVDAEAKPKMINPAAVTMTGWGSAENALTLQLPSILKFENGKGMVIEDNVNQVLTAIRNNQATEVRDYVLVTAQGQKHPVSVTVTPVTSGHGERIITFRDITDELAKEGEQTEFISTASHEMRTPVASIEGYLGLALNPQTATIDDRAKKYLEEAHSASQHLGRLFKDLLDVTKLDDNKMRVHMVPIEVVETIKGIVDGQVPEMGKKNIRYSFGQQNSVSGGGNALSAIDQTAYAMVDLDFLREVIGNLIENAIKYTEEGGAIWVNVRGDGDRVLINVTDTGIGISPDDLKHIFQKFYRVDNSQTRTIGGTGLGLYIVKQRIESMGGKVWAESSFGEGSTFYVSLPRLTLAEYERRKEIIANSEAMAAGTKPTAGKFTSSGFVKEESAAPATEPAQPVVTTTPAPEAAAPAPTPEAPAQPTPAPAAPTPTPAAPAPVPTPTPAAPAQPAPAPTQSAPAQPTITTQPIPPTLS